MPDEMKWYMRLTMQNSRTGKQAFVMYPCEKFDVLESLDLCGVPYGGGEYTHLAESYNGVAADSLQQALAGVIEHSECPPSVQELNHLGARIQSMSEDDRQSMERELTGASNPTITDAINITHRLRGESMVYGGSSMADRAVVLESGEPYVRVWLYDESDVETNWEEADEIWADCPVSQADLEAAAVKLGAESYRDVGVGSVVSVIEDLYELTGDMVTVDEINRFADALQKNNVAESLAKYKAVLRMEICDDLSEATELAASLDEYEFYPGETMETVGGRFREQGDLASTGSEIADDMGFDETDYGVIRKAEDHTLEQSMELG